MDGDVLMFAQVMTVIVLSVASFVAILAERLPARTGERAGDSPVTSVKRVNTPH
jgi:hypothetical protein